MDHGREQSKQANADATGHDNPNSDNPSKRASAGRRSSNQSRSEEDNILDEVNKEQHVIVLGPNAQKVDQHTSKGLELRVGVPSPRKNVQHLFLVNQPILIHTSVNQSNTMEVQNIITVTPGIPTILMSSDVSPESPMFLPSSVDTHTAPIPLAYEAPSANSNPTPTATLFYPVPVQAVDDKPKINVTIVQDKMNKDYQQYQKMKQRMNNPAPVKEPVQLVQEEEKKENVIESSPINLHPKEERHKESSDKPYKKRVTMKRDEWMRQIFNIPIDNPQPVRQQPLQDIYPSEPPKNPQDKLLTEAQRKQYRQLLDQEIGKLKSDQHTKEYQSDTSNNKVFTERSKKMIQFVEGNFYSKQYAHSINREIHDEIQENTRCNKVSTMKIARRTQSRLRALCAYLGIDDFVSSSKEQLSECDTKGEELDYFVVFTINSEVQIKLKKQVNKAFPVVNLFPFLACRDNYYFIKPAQLFKIIRASLAYDHSKCGNTTTQAILFVSNQYHLLKKLDKQLGFAQKVLNLKKLALSDDCEVLTMVIVCPSKVEVEVCINISRYNWSRHIQIKCLQYQEICDRILRDSEQSCSTRLYTIIDIVARDLNK